MAERIIPEENFEGGLLKMDIPELGIVQRGKVRDNWVYEGHRIMVTTDRQSAFDVVLATTPGKGVALNLLSVYWFEQGFEQGIVSTHMEAVPHPNVLIARQAVVTLPVEVVLRRYMARSSSSTSVFRHYSEGKRRIYGVEFPDRLVANQEFPMGTIVTPTTKAEVGHHDEMIDDGEAQGIVDSQLGQGVWRAAKNMALELFCAARYKHLRSGLILVDTKYEFGVDRNGELILIDEVHTPDSSRFWLLSSYGERMAKGEDPEAFDKEILRKWLAKKGFTGDGDVPVIDPDIRTRMAEAYKVPYQMVTGRRLPEADSSPEVIKSAIFRYLDNPKAG